MSQLYTVGRVISDPEPKVSSRNTSYASFLFVERVGIGDYAHDQYIMVYAKEPLANRLIKAGVRSRSLVWLAGALELVEYTKKSDGTRDKGLRLMLSDWGYLPADRWQGSKPQSGTREPEVEGTNGVRAAVINGDRESLPG